MTWFEVAELIYVALKYGCVLMGCFVAFMIPVGVISWFAPKVCAWFDRTSQMKRDGDSE